MRIALGLSYCGQAYEGWQSQLQWATRYKTTSKHALSTFADQPVQHLVRWTHAMQVSMV
jgi:tRNA U38,U39,U40 pseudouridine synthase TruA